MQIDRKKLMQEAWASARRRADTFGTKVRDEFRLALKEAWASAKKAAAVVAAAPVAAPTLAERTWGPQLERIAAREAAGVADDMDAAIRKMAEASIADHAAHVAHMARLEAIRARFA